MYNSNANNVNNVNNNVNNVNNNVNNANNNVNNVNNADKKKDKAKTETGSSSENSWKEIADFAKRAFGSSQNTGFVNPVAAPRYQPIATFR